MKTRAPSGAVNARRGSASGLTKHARTVLDRTAKARAEIDRVIVGVSLDGDPPVLGPRRPGRRRGRFK